MTRIPRRARLLREALALWRGAAMQDVGLPDSAAFDAAVTRLEGLRLTAMEDVRCGDQPRPRCGSGHGTDRPGGRASAARTARRCADACPRCDRPRPEALLVYQRTREAWPTRWASTPRRSVRIARRAAAGRAGTAGGDPEDQPACRADQLRRQDADVAAVRELIAEHRLTTLVGPGGSGRPGWPRKPPARCSATCRTGPGWWSSQLSARTATWRNRRSPRSGSGMRCSAAHRTRNRRTGSSPRSASGKRC